MRKEDSQESIRRDTILYNILQDNPTKVFDTIRASKKKNARKIGKLIVNGKVYAGEAVPDGFYDSLLHLKSYDQNQIQNKESFSRYQSDYSNIIKLCSAGQEIPRITLGMELLTGTVPVNNSLLTGTVPVNNFLLTGTVPVNKSLLAGTGSWRPFWIVQVIPCFS